MPGIPPTRATPAAEGHGGAFLRLERPRHLHLGNAMFPLRSPPGVPAVSQGEEDGVPVCLGVGGSGRNLSKLEVRQVTPAAPESRENSCGPVPAARHQASRDRTTWHHPGGQTTQGRRGSVLSGQQQT